MDEMISAAKVQQMKDNAAVVQQEWLRAEQSVHYD